MTNHRCPQCETTLPVDAPEGLCPRCLLRAGLPPAGERTEQQSAPVSQEGTKLRYLGDYRLLEEIARGGMGVVFRARQVSLNRDVAVKMILAGALADEEAVQRFLAEAEAAALLQHPGIVTIHEVGRQGEQHYFSMDLVDGPNLGELVVRGPLDPMRAARYVRSIAEAIQFAHQRGILHRDLKPQNVLVDAEDNPRVTDFGLARQIDGGGLTESGTVLGSPSYMPPEQALGQLGRLGPASDVYSLGAVLYELLTGQPPFSGSSVAAILHRLVHDEPAPPARLNPRVPADLERICLKCLEKSPERRYSSARALAEDLQRFLDGQPVLARRASRGRRAVAWAARHPWTVCALAALLLLGTCGLAFGLWEENRYLIWRQSHPGHMRQAGALAARLKQVGDLGSLLFVVLLWANFDYPLRSRRQTWSEFLHSDGSSDPCAPTYPLPPGMVRVYGALGLLGLGYALAFGAMTIQAYVWEGVFSIKNLIGVLFPAAFFGLTLVWLAVREQGPARAEVPTIDAATARRIHELSRGPVDRRMLLALVVAQLALLGLAGAVLLHYGLGLAAPCGYAVGLLWGVGIMCATRIEARGARLLLYLGMGLALAVLPAIGASEWIMFYWFSGIFAGVYTFHAALRRPEKMDGEADAA